MSRSGGIFDTTLIFDPTDETRGVYLFDEFDAFGGDREARIDVGEIRRVLNSLLRFLKTGCLRQRRGCRHQPPADSRQGALPAG